MHYKGGQSHQTEMEDIERKDLDKKSWEIWEGAYNGLQEV